MLNEVVVDRGPSSYLSNVDLYLDGRLITSVQGDGMSVMSVLLTRSQMEAVVGSTFIAPPSFAHYIPLSMCRARLC